MSRRRQLDPFETEIRALTRDGAGVGVAPDGHPVVVRGAPPGSRVAVAPGGRRKGVWAGRRTALVRPPAAYAAPPCPVFGLCGGCALQELSLEAQREAKHRYGLDAVRRAWSMDGAPFPDGIAVHPARGDERAYAYRNKVELSFGTGRYLSEADHAAGLPIAGRFLGFHAPGRFDRVVDVERCHLVDEPMNRVIAATRAVALAPDSPPPWDPRAHTGFWRHLLTRQGYATGEILAAVYTATPGPGDEAAVERWAEAVRGADLAGGRLAGLVWFENAGVADAAQGVVRRTWGGDTLEEKLLGRAFRLSATSFFQTNTAGAEVLYQTVGEALGDAGGTLVDLYCGTGSIGICVGGAFDRVVGIEERASAVDDARGNAVRNGIAAEFRVGRVEDALDVVKEASGRRAIVVDPPRAGLHPKVAGHLAGADAEVLVYVACNPGSLGRDGVILAGGGWRLTDLWTVDLFPQTGHVEVVGRFTRG